jgi:hypothetical protein
MATTYHAKGGRFCKADSAKIVSRGGEKFKVVRQHHRVDDSGKIVRKGRKGKAEEAIRRSNAARQRMALAGDLSAPGFLSVSEMFTGRRSSLAEAKKAKKGG